MSPVRALRLNLIVVRVAVLAVVAASAHAQVRTPPPATSATRQAPPAVTAPPTGPTQSQVPASPPKPVELSFAMKGQGEFTVSSPSIPTPCRLHNHPADSAMYTGTPNTYCGYTQVPVKAGDTVAVNLAPIGVGFRVRHIVSKHALDNQDMGLLPCGAVRCSVVVSEGQNKLEIEVTELVKYKWEVKAFGAPRALLYVYKETNPYGGTYCEFINGVPKSPCTGQRTMYERLSVTMPLNQNPGNVSMVFANGLGSFERQGDQVVTAEVKPSSEMTLQVSFGSGAGLGTRVQSTSVVDANGMQLSSPAIGDCFAGQGLFSTSGCRRTNFPAGSRVTLEIYNIPAGAKPKWCPIGCDSVMGNVCITTLTAHRNLVVSDGGC